MNKSISHYACIVWLFLSLNSAAQPAGKYNNIWPIRTDILVDFNLGSPAITNRDSIMKHPLTSACDRFGNLLFYVTDTSVYDRNHQLMPNGIIGTKSTEQVALIAPKADEDSVYYVFHLDRSDYSEMLVFSPTKLYYSIVDLRLNGGFGAVIAGEKNILIDTGFCEDMVLAGICGKLWLIIQNYHVQKFYAYDLTKPTGLSSPVISAPIGIPPICYGGRMTMSKQMNKIASLAYCLYSGPECFILDYDFDIATGKVSNYRKIDAQGSRTGTIYYGRCGNFSNDLSKRYISYAEKLIQYDLSAGSPSAIKLSEDSICKDHSSSTRMGPDGKLYIPNIFSILMTRLNAPNNSGTLVGLEDIPTPPWYKHHGIGNDFGKDYIPFTSDEKSLFTYNTNKTLCKGRSITLSFSGFDDYIWNDGDTSANKTINKPGIYWRKSSYKCVTQVDTFNVSELDATDIVVDLDTIICFDTSITLTIPVVYDSVFWENGDNSRVRTITKDGKYYYIASKTGDSCKSFLRKNISIQFKDITSLKSQLNLQDTFICKGQSIELDATLDYKDLIYQWSTGSTLSKTQINTPGIYWVNIKIGNCQISDTSTINNLFNPIKLKDSILCKGEEISLDAGFVMNAKYLWNTGDTLQSIKTKESGFYSVKISKNGCSEEAGSTIKFTNCVKCVLVPNAFTPNNDRINDVFKPIFNCPMTDYEFLIFNRWGQQVFYSKDINDNWDGSYNGKLQNSNVYYYVLKFKILDEPEKGTQQITGDVSLVR